MEISVLTLKLSKAKMQGFLEMTHQRRMAEPHHESDEESDPAEVERADGRIAEIENFYGAVHIDRPCSWEVESKADGAGVTSRTRYD